MYEYCLYSCLSETRLRNVFFECSLDVGVKLVVKSSLSSDVVEDGLMLGSEVIKVSLFESTDVCGLDVVEISLNTSVQDAHLLFSWHWNVLLLLEYFSQFLSSI